MDTSTLALIGIAALVALAAVALVLRRGQRGASDPWAPPSDSAAPRAATPAPARSQAGIGPAERAEIEALIKQGQTISAIKRVRELTGLGLKEAKDYVDTWSAGGSPPALAASAPPTAAGDGMAEVRALAAAGNKIGAIKRYRELTRVGLKEAKDFVEALGE